ncbi:type II toxin-antitoxin system PemK/MazF family toxin [Azospirillum sp. YIM B02556]|uniref:Type II toxin-antitoxin system PemK/MazF family toxin n=2 Tax=Azospirillum endophyticum TaxID=2800326 RepID=A0ABS1FEB5_9PROT|nr:type II toxin-antitoxin system PemK/MazF family toxin [Azospirillum endophyticum]MBK1841777.1 type II toxin-antitoxin system PemK/MazF family toxin [Azospirillum endophyticum]
MPTFEAWNVVKVPFPYADRPVRQRRPALVIAANDLQASHSLVWVLMITSAENRSWPSDVLVSDLGAAGLPAPSVVRTAKVAVIDARDAELLGTLTVGDRRTVSRQVGRHLEEMLKADGSV